MPDFTDSELLQSARYDAFHGVVVAAAMTDNHPLQAVFREHFSAVIKAVDAYGKPADSGPPRQWTGEGWVSLYGSEVSAHNLTEPQQEGKK